MQNIDELLQPITIDGILINVPEGIDIVRMQIAMGKEKDENVDNAEHAYIFAGKAVAACTHYDDGAALQVAAIRGISDKLVQACLARCGMRMGNPATMEDDETEVDPSTLQEQQE